MKTVGLTGGIASGKSTLANMLEEKGAIVVDADKIARDQTEVGQPAYEAIVSHFGKSILNSDDTINRRELARIVFSHPGRLSTLNRLTHGVIVGEIKRRLKEIKRTSKSGGVIIIDVPLLIESGLDQEVDFIIVITSDEKKRMKRLKDIGLSEEETRNRLKAQMIEQERLSHADFVVENNGTMEELQTKVEDLWLKLIKEKR